MMMMRTDRLLPLQHEHQNISINPHFLHAFVFEGRQ